MRIGIDISQVAYGKTGVARSVSKLIQNLVLNDRKNHYVFFFSSLRNDIPPLLFQSLINSSNVEIKSYKFPQSFLTFLWNRLHVLPIEWLIGKVDVFVSSDWTEPPVKRAKKVTFIHDMTVFLFPKETDRGVIKTQKKKLSWSVKECDAFITPSLATKKDVVRILGISPEKVKVVPWGATL